MFLCVAFFSAIVAMAATVLGVWIYPETPWWYAVFIAPGLVPFELFSRSQQTHWLGNAESWLAFAITFLYYFGLIFALVFWADRRWRRKRAERIDA
jgi:hypothetical protein